MPHLTLAANEKAFKKLFDAIVHNAVFEHSDSASLGPLTASYHIKFHLENGSVDLRGDNTIRIAELDIKWDILDLTLAFDFPEICFGGFCIIPIPFDGCALEFPEICLFSDNPDLTVTLPLGGITSELSAIGTLFTKYHVNPDRPTARPRGRSVGFAGPRRGRPGNGASSLTLSPLPIISVRFSESRSPTFVMRTSAHPTITEAPNVDFLSTH
jgi:hypothetical protein